MDRQPDDIAIADVEIGMCGKKRPRLGSGRLGKPIDIMMAVALGMGDADQARQAPDPAARRGRPDRSGPPPAMKNFSLDPLHFAAPVALTIDL